MAAEIDLSLYDFALASATGAVSTPIGKRITFAKRGLQYSFTRLGEKNVPAGLDSNLMRHRVVNDSVRQSFNWRQTK
jgi:hypothetical protein